MNYIQKLQSYGDTHQNIFIDILRIILGVILVLKGYYYIANTDELNAFLLNNEFHLYNYFIIHCVAFAHLIGGICIILGLLTRIAVIVQIPILLGAIIFFNDQSGLFTAESEFSLQILVLSLLIVFFFYGSGKWSMDYYMAHHKDKWEGTPSDL